MNMILDQLQQFSRKLLRILSSVRARTIAYSDGIASETYQRADLPIAGKITVRRSPTGLSAADTTTLGSITSRSAVMGVWIFELLGRPVE